MTGPHWMLRHPDLPDAVCIITDDEYDSLMLAGWPEGTFVKSLNLVTLTEYLAAARAKQRGSA